jgi:predicted Zn-dependent protease
MGDPEVTGWLILLALAQDPEVLSRQGSAAMKAGRFAEAEKIYRELIGREPGNVMWRMNLGLALSSAGRYGEAVPEFQAYLKARPEPGAIHLLLGVANLKQDRPCEAIEPLETAGRWNRAMALVELGDAYAGCRRFEKAGRTYEAALARKPGDLRLARQAGFCYWQARLYPEARKLLQLAESAYSAEAAFHYEYGDTLARLEGAAAGIEHLARAVALDPGLTAARGEYGKALLETRRAAESIPHLEAASRQDPSLLLPLSRAYRAAGRNADAEAAQAEYRRRLGR